MTHDADAPKFGPELVPESPIPSSSGTTRGESDGRIALRLKNRQRVIDALIELVDGGNISPSMDEIVARSGMSERSVFRYFKDLADLSISAIRSVVERAQPVSVIEDAGEGTLDHRIDAMIAMRLSVAELMHSFGTLARRKLMLTPEIQVALTNAIVSFRAQLVEQFTAELDAMTDEQAAMVLDILVTLFSYEGLDVIWHQLGNDHEAVAKRWRMTMKALLTETP